MSTGRHEKADKTIRKELSRLSNRANWKPTVTSKIAASLWRDECRGHFTSLPKRKKKTTIENELSILERKRISVWEYVLHNKLRSCAQRMRRKQHVKVQLEDSRKGWSEMIGDAN